MVTIGHRLSSYTGGRQAEHAAITHRSISYIADGTARPDACLAEDHAFRPQGASHHVRPLAPVKSGQPTPAITAPDGDSSLTHRCAWKGTSHHVTAQSSVPNLTEGMCVQCLAVRRSGGWVCPMCTWPHAIEHAVAWLCSSIAECVHNAQLADGRDVVVKVLPRHQAQHEAGILRSLAPHPETRVIDLLFELPLPCGLVALVMPLVPHRLFEETTADMVLHQWLQLCEVRGWLHHDPVPNTTHADTCLHDTARARLRSLGYQGIQRWR